jgi:hypothetical protein
MSRSRKLFGVEERLPALDDRLTLEVLLELELELPVNGLLRPDCVCSCMNDGWLIVKTTTDSTSVGDGRSNGMLANPESWDG